MLTAIFAEGQWPCKDHHSQYIYNLQGCLSQKTLAKLFFLCFGVLVRNKISYNFYAFVFSAAPKY